MQEGNQNGDRKLDSRFRRYTGTFQREPTPSADRPSSNHGDSVGGDDLADGPWPSVGGSPWGGTRLLVKPLRRGEGGMLPRPTNLGGVPGEGSQKIEK